MPEVEPEEEREDELDVVVGLERLLEDELLTAEFLLEEDEEELLTDELFPEDLVEELFPEDLVEELFPEDLVEEDLVSEDFFCVCVLVVLFWVPVRV